MSKAIVLNAKERQFLRFGQSGLLGNCPELGLPIPSGCLPGIGLPLWETADLKGFDIMLPCTDLSADWTDPVWADGFDPLYPDRQVPAVAQKANRTRPIAGTKKTLALPRAATTEQTHNQEMGSVLAHEFALAMKQAGLTARVDTLASGERLLTVEEFFGADTVREREFVWIVGGNK
jgi:hypothetical protein